MSKIYDDINEIDKKISDKYEEELKEIEIFTDKQGDTTKKSKKYTYSLIIGVMMLALFLGYYLAGLYLNKTNKTDVKNVQSTYKVINKEFSNKTTITELAEISQNKENLKKILTELLKISNKDNIINNNIALILCEMENYKEALVYAEKLIIQEPNNPYYWNTFGIVLTYLNLFDDAEKSFKKAISLKADEGIFYYNLGNLYEREGKLDLAKEYYLNYLSKGDKYNVQNMKAIKQKILRGL